jgi:hypothetical protein
MKLLVFLIALIGYIQSCCFLKALAFGGGFGGFGGGQAAPPAPIVISSDDNDDDDGPGYAHGGFGYGGFPGYGLGRRF